MGYASKVADKAKPVGQLAKAAPSDCVWSAQQNAIFRWFKEGEGNLVVEARAGTGKTTTIIEAVKSAPEKTILLAAFNKRIKEELESRITSSPHIEAKTLHAIGFMLVREYWPGVRVA